MLDLSKISDTQIDLIKAIGFQLLKVSGVLFVAYVSASTLSAFFVSFIMEYTKGPPPRRSGSANPVELTKRINYRDFNKVVLARNIFNKDGEYPEEEDPEETEAPAAVTFDASGPCTKTTLSLELLGTIYLGETGVSLATVQERGYSFADTYKEGDSIIGNAQAKVYKIEQKRVVFNNSGKKECLEFKESKRPLVASVGSTPVTRSDPIVSNSDGAIRDIDSVTVKECLGEGYEKILKQGRLIPHQVGGEMLGFKLIGVKPKSCYEKIGLKVNDVITQVNDESMRQADKGFALYEALGSADEIRISVLRNDAPVTTTVRIQ